MYSLKGLISPRISFVNSRFLLVSAILTIYFLLGKTCRAQFFLQLWLVLGVIWSEFSMLVCFVQRFFRIHFLQTPKKDVSLKVPKQQTLSPLLLGKNMWIDMWNSFFFQDSFWKSGFLELVSLASTIRHEKRWNFTVFLCRNICSRVWCSIGVFFCDDLSSEDDFKPYPPNYSWRNGRFRHENLLVFRASNFRTSKWIEHNKSLTRLTTFLPTSLSSDWFKGWFPGHVFVLRWFQVISWVWEG